MKKTIKGSLLERVASQIKYSSLSTQILCTTVCTVQWSRLTHQLYGRNCRRSYSSSTICSIWSNIPDGILQFFFPCIGCEAFIFMQIASTYKLKEKIWFQICLELLLQAYYIAYGFFFFFFNLNCRNSNPSIGKNGINQNCLPSFLINCILFLFSSNVYNFFFLFSSSAYYILSI